MKKNICIKFFRVVAIVILSIIVLFSLFIGGLNIFKHFYYKDYYSSLTKVGRIAGLEEGFVPQGLTYYDDGGYSAFISAGYMGDNSPSRIYAVRENTNEKSYFTLTSGGKPFFGHTGGIQYEDGFFYLANEGTGLYIFDSHFIKDSESGSSVEIGAPMELINNTSFVFSQPDYLYVGEFNNNDKYACSNSISYNGKTHKAIVTKYRIDELLVPVAVYSIPDEIQGFCITDDGTIVLSRSYSVSSSNFYVYKPENIIETGELYKGATVYFLDEPDFNIKGPAMSEDLDLYKGKVITHFESACNKYLFGKLFFANYIAALEL